MIIKNCNIITWGNPNQIIENKCILIKNGIIAKIDNAETLIFENPTEPVVDARNQYILPSNICAHTHFYGAYSRGLYIPGSPPKDFPQILNKLWWPLDKSLNRDAIKYSALVCFIDAIKHGTTTLFDHHASQNQISDSLDIIDEAAEMAGVRVALCYELTDRDGKRKTDEGAQENIRYISKVKNSNKKNKRAAFFGLHASLTLSPASLELARKLTPSGFGFHIHVAEHSIDEYDSLEKYQMRVVERLDKHHLLGEDTIVIHGVHLDAKEIQILAKTKTWVSHQPRSNMNNGVGMADIESMDHSGIRVCLGNDGFSNAMWEEWKAVYLAHKLWHRDPQKMSGNLVKKMAIDNNSALASRFFKAKIGRVEPGYCADLIFVDFHPFTPMTVDNIPWHIIFGFHESLITSTMVDGEFLMKDRVMTTLDEISITREAIKLAPRIWNNYRKMKRLE